MSDYDDDDFFPEDNLDIDYDDFDKVFYDEEKRAWFACDHDGTTIDESRSDCEEDAVDFWWDHVYDPDIDGPDDEDEDDQEPNESENNSEDESDDDSDDNE